MMSRLYNTKSSPLRFASPYIKFSGDEAALALMAILFQHLSWVVFFIPTDYFLTPHAIIDAAHMLRMVAVILALLTVILVICAVVLYFETPNPARIRQIIRRGLCDPKFGNPLHLKD